MERCSFSADVYLDDFYGAEIPALVETGFPTAAKKVSLGIHVNTDDWTLSVPDFQLLDLSDELHLWLSRKHFTIKELQSILGKLSFRSRPF